MLRQQGVQARTHARTSAHARTAWMHAFMHACMLHAFTRTCTAGSAPSMHTYGLACARLLSSPALQARPCLHAWSRMGQPLYNQHRCSQFRELYDEILAYKFKYPVSACTMSARACTHECGWQRAGGRGARPLRHRATQTWLHAWRAACAGLPPLPTTLAPCRWSRPAASPSSSCSATRPRSTQVRAWGMAAVHAHVG